MAFTFDSTAGGSSANSYLSVSDADDIIGGLLDDGGWSDATELQKQQALVMATRAIDAQNLGGQKYDTSITDGAPDQALHFPRGEDTYSSGGSTVKYIPEQVKQACALQAVYVLQRKLSPDLIDRSRLQREGVTTVAMGGVSEQFRPGVHDPSVELCPEALKLLRGFLHRRARLLSDRQLGSKDSNMRAWFAT